MAEPTRTRVHYSIDNNVVRLFALIAPHRTRSSIVEGLISKWCDDNQRQLLKENASEIKRLRTVVDQSVT